MFVRILSDRVLFKLKTHQIKIFFACRIFVNILHIDDSPEICQLYSDMFKGDSDSFQSIHDGKKGLELAIRNNYDLILLDMCMPIYNGMEFLKDLKKKKPSELKKVVVVSVLKFTTSQVNELLKMGIHAVEEKPSNLQKLETIKKNMWLK